MKEIIFSKYSNERGRRFALRTDILKDGNQVRYVEKRAMYPQGKTHVENISRWYELLTKAYLDTKISMNRCVMTEDGVELEYLEGTTLEDELDGLMAQGQIEEAVEILCQYLDEVKKGFTLETFEMTDSFRETFGEAELSSQLLSAPVSDIDMVLNNVVIADGWNVIDYEWTFDFPIPYNFVAYRILHYYIEGNTTRDPLHGYHLMNRLGMTEEEIQIYEKMEMHFQKVYLLSQGEGESPHVPIRLLYNKVSPGSLDLKSVEFNEQNNKASRRVQLYQAPDMNFSEEHSEYKELHKEGIFLDYFQTEPDSKYLRLDPCSRYCIVENLRMQWGDDITRYQMNGIVMEEEKIFFPVDDPQIIIERPQGAMGDFRVYFEITYLTMEEALQMLQQIYGRQRREMSGLKDQLQLKENQIRNMENTKIWKAYAKYRRAFSK